MTKDDFRNLIQQRVAVLDGATGTELSKRGMPATACPESWILENPDSLTELQTQYCQNGSDIIYTPTFGANRIRLQEFGQEDRVIELNESLARLTRKSAGNRLVFADLSSTGLFIKPNGDADFEEVVDVFKQQIAGLLKGGVDGFVVESIIDLQEARAALLAVRETCDLPVMITISVDESGKTLTGTDPLAALVTLQSLGASAFGCNCSTGAEPMVSVIKQLKPYATIPLVAKPNAMSSGLSTKKQAFDSDPEMFAAFAQQLAEAGANLIGGCCGTGPDAIALLTERVGKSSPVRPSVNALSALSSPRETRLLDFSQPFAVIGERINPTGKKTLQAELREGEMATVSRFAREQTSNGASILDINMGLSGIDEKAMMLTSIDTALANSTLPLCIDTSNPDVMETALRYYPGRALVNSISAERKRLEETLPAAMKYGAMFILLPLSDEGIPETCRERIRIVEQVFAAAAGYGCKVADVTVDGLIMTISSNQDAAKVSLDLVDWARNDFGSNTVFGLSNVSFGMPERTWINASFLAMAIGRGLTMAIANPSSELLMQTVRAGNRFKDDE